MSDPSPSTLPTARQIHEAMTEAIRYALTCVLERAVGTCEHIDPGGPIYDHTRACTRCCVDAVMELMAGPHPADQATRDRLAAAVTNGAAPRVGHWLPGHGFVPAGDPRVAEFWRAEFWWHPGPVTP